MQCADYHGFILSRVGDYGPPYVVGNLYKQVKDPNLVCALTGHKEGSKAFNRYRMIDEETNRQTMSYLE